MNLSAVFGDYIRETGFKIEWGGDDLDDFEILLCECRGAVERFVNFRLPSKFDAEDVLQEVYLAAHSKFGTLQDRATFKAWLIGIARHKCNDYYPKRAKSMEIPLEEISETALSCGRMGITETSVVHETLGRLAAKDQEMLTLYFFRDLPQSEIAKKLGIPIGTVKSRLHVAKQNFKQSYPYPPKPKGDDPMKKLPEFMPEYQIAKSDKAPFSVVWEELMGWFLVPKLGEKLSFGIYDMPSRKCDHFYDMAVTGKAEVHEIEGVELTARESDYSKKQEAIHRTFVAQLTDTHCRYLASLRTENGVRKYITFLDGDAFLPTWGFGENNCGNETHLEAKGDIVRNGNIISSADKPFLVDIVGRNTVTIGGKEFDTVCVMDIEAHNPGVVSEQFLDKSGRTILWRRFNRDDWAFDHYKRKWSEALPNNERLIINGETYVHWYDCITDYIL